MTDWLFASLIILYCLSILYLWWGWERIPITTNEENPLSAAVIIPVRNEVVNIKSLLEDLHQQIYQGALEVLIIDDHSEDGTRELVEKYIKGKPHFKLIVLENEKGKKQGLKKGVLSTKADLILTTDGDCRVPDSWVEAMVNSFRATTQFVSGPVSFKKEEGFFNKIQAIEFASLIGSGGALIGWQKPLMANGANMGFRRAAFLEVNGFDGNENTASGDDVFLLHKIASQFSDSIAFVKQEEAIIMTKAQPSVASFVSQRIRWASKWKGYKNTFAKLTAVLVFMLSFSLFAFPFVVGFNRPSMFLWLNLWAIKSFFDFFFIRQISRFLGQKIELLSFVLLQILYPFYVVFIALFSFQKSYVWKGRRVQ